jgi:hypothetical protein
MSLAPLRLYSRAGWPHFEMRSVCLPRHPRFRPGAPVTLVGLKSCLTDELEFQGQVNGVVSVAVTPALHRLATWTDFDRVYEIYMHPAVIPYLGFDPMSRDDFRLVYQELLASDAFYVVEVEGTVEGFYKTARQEGRSSHVVTLGPLAVAPE